MMRTYAKYVMVRYGPELWLFYFMTQVVNKTGTQYAV